jgi:hypothetical protein
MKIKLDQQMQDEYGKPVKHPGKPPLTLRDVITRTLLEPVRNPHTGALDEPGDKKAEKYELFRKVQKQRKEIDLKAEEVTLIKKCIEKFEAQLIQGEAHEMIEGKYEPMILEPEEKEEKDNQNNDNNEQAGTDNQKG